MEHDELALKREIADFQTMYAEHVNDIPDCFIRFDHYDQTILDPFHSPCLRFTADPEEQYGDDYRNSAWFDPVCIKQVRMFVLKNLLKNKLHDAFNLKLVELYGYVEDMVDTTEGLTPAECGLDPEHNVDEIIKELKAL